MTFLRERASYVDATRSPTADAYETTRLFRAEPIGVTDCATGVGGSEVKTPAGSGRICEIRI